MGKRGTVAQLKSELSAMGAEPSSPGSPRSPQSPRSPKSPSSPRGEATKTRGRRTALTTDRYDKMGEVEHTGGQRQSITKLKNKGAGGDTEQKESGPGGSNQPGPSGKKNWKKLDGAGGAGGAGGA